MDPRRLSDPRELTALAHPVRISIIEQLTIDGPLTATELAGRLGETPANCSWHLRKLAEHGFVEEAPTQGGRRRPWQMSTLGFSWKGADETPELRRAAQALSDLVMGRAFDRLREANERAADEEPDWREASDGTESILWLTAEELREMNVEIREVIVRHVGRHADPSTRPPGSRLCELVAWGVPTYLPGAEATR